MADLGRDLEAIAIGLMEVMDENYLHYRIRSIEYLTEKLPGSRGTGYATRGHGCPDAKKFMPHIPVSSIRVRHLPVRFLWRVVSEVVRLDH